MWVTTLRVSFELPRYWCSDAVFLKLFFVYGGPLNLMCNTAVKAPLTILSIPNNSNLTSEFIDNEIKHTIIWSVVIGNVLNEN